MKFMDKNQWFVFGIGFIILSGYMFLNATGLGSCVSYSDDALMISCSIRRYAYAIPGVISVFLGWIFLICGFLEAKKK